MPKFLMKFMKINKTAIVTTTINIPIFLESYKNFLNDNVQFIIIGDLKTPPKAKKFAEKFEYVEFMNIEDQKKWIEKTIGPKFADAIAPYNSIRRRNLGYLKALEFGAKSIITVDDDNYPQAHWLKEHMNKCKYLVNSINSIANPCRMLNLNHENIYSRGYPITEFFRDSFETVNFGNLKTKLNLGLWKLKPDVDSFTNLIYSDLESEGIKNEFESSYIIDSKNYFPLNSQNTRFDIELLPAFPVLIMDTQMQELKIDRYDDIWAGWIIEKLMDKMGDYASFGIPLTHHKRNVHNYVSDLKNEFIGMTLNSEIFNLIKNMDIDSTNYADGYNEIADKFKNIKSRNFELDKFFIKMRKFMKTWIEIVDKL